MIRRTGEAAQAAGIYHSNCKCRAELRVRPGDRFPDCPGCRRPATWLFSRSIHDDPSRTAFPPMDE